jgi:hypothetical protein
MSEPIVILALRRKRDKIESAIAGYERKIKEAQADGLGHKISWQDFRVRFGTSVLELTAFGHRGCRALRLCNPATPGRGCGLAKSSPKIAKFPEAPVPTGTSPQMNANRASCGPRGGLK